MRGRWVILGRGTCSRTLPGGESVCSSVGLDAVLTSHKTRSDFFSVVYRNDFEIMEKS